SLVYLPLMPQQRAKVLSTARVPELRRRILAARDGDRTVRAQSNRSYWIPVPNGSPDSATCHGIPKLRLITAVRDKRLPVGTQGPPSVQHGHEKRRANGVTRTRVPSLDSELVVVPGVVTGR